MSDAEGQADRVEPTLPDKVAAASAVASPQSAPVSAPTSLSSDDENQLAQAGVLVTILAGIFVFLAFQIGWSRWTRQAIELERLPERRYDFRIDINQANDLELQHLPGIGPVLAARIIKDREANGPFANVDALRRVRGVGPILVERITPYLRWPSADAKQRTTDKRLGQNEPSRPETEE